MPSRTIAVNGIIVVRAAAAAAVVASRRRVTLVRTARSDKQDFGVAAAIALATAVSSLGRQGLPSHNAVGGLVLVLT